MGQSLLLEELLILLPIFWLSEPFVLTSLAPFQYFFRSAQKTMDWAKQ